MKSVVRVVVSYLVVAGLWIVASDRVVETIGLAESQRLQSIKGLLFVAVTGGVLWLVLSREESMRRVATSEIEAARQELHEREAEYRSLFESNPQPMWVYDVETLEFLAVNQAAIDKYGYSRDEFLGMRISDIRPAEDIPALKDNIAQLDEGIDHAGTWRHVTKSGEVLHVEITSHVVHFGARRAELVHAHDVTHAVAAERALRAAKRQVDAVIETSPMAIILLDREGRVQLWNPAAEQVFGWAASEVLGRFNPIVPESDTEGFRSQFDRILDGELATGIRAERRTKEGDLITVMLFTAPIVDDDGRIESAIGLFADITEQVRVEKELTEYRERLEELVDARTAELSIVNERLTTATRVKSEFLANMSHELRTPLNSVIGFSGAMLQGLAGPLNDEQMKQLGMVYRSGKHLLELINDILDLSKIEAGRYSVDPQEFDVVVLVHSVVESLEVQIAEKRLEVNVESSEPEVRAVTDRTKVQQILLNLIGNAVKFTDRGGVRATVELSDGELVIGVSDTGPGIPRSEHALIFDEFTQSRKRAEAKPEGTGLGLAISRRLARILGGDIAVNSEVGAGSTFTLKIPATFARDDTPLGVEDTGSQWAQSNQDADS